MTIRLTVTTAKESTGKRVGLSPDAFDRLGIADGDPVAIEGTRRSAALATVVESIASDAVALGSTTRENVGASPGESVSVEAVDPPVADSVTLAPLQSLALTSGGDALATALVGFPLLAGERLRVTLFSGAVRLPLVVVSTDPEGLVRVDEGTAVVVRDEPADTAGSRRDPHERVSFEDVGGLDDEVDLLSDIVVDPLSDPARYERLGQPPTAGVLLGGPGGAGKTLLVHALVTETDATYVPLRGGRLAGLAADAAAERISEASDTARRTDGPALVHVDELGAAAPDDADGTERRLVTELVDLIEAFADDPAIAVVAESRDPEAVADRLRRAGRLERHVELPVPGPEERAAILDVLVRPMRLASDADLGTIARRTHGYVGADLSALCREATRVAARGDDRPAVGAAAFEAALSAVEPSAMRSFSPTVPETTYDDVGGLAGAKREIARAVEWPLYHPDLFERFGATPPRGILLYGPPGTGKTLLVRAVANATDANFISVDGPELLDKFVGESEKAVREVFRTARRNAPAVIFFDEIDALTTVRGQGSDAGGSRAPERVVSQLLTEIDGLEGLEEVTVVGATNRPDRIDPALLRPGRLERAIEVPMPDLDARCSVLAIHAEDVPVGEVDLRALGERTEGYTGSDLEALVREASLLAIEDRVTTERVSDPPDELVVTADHFERALSAVDRSVDSDRQAYYDRLGERL